MARSILLFPILTTVLIFILLIHLCPRPPAGLTRTSKNSLLRQPEQAGPYLHDRPSNRLIAWFQLESECRSSNRQIAGGRRSSHFFECAWAGCRASWAGWRGFPRRVREVASPQISKQEWNSWQMDKSGKAKILQPRLSRARPNTIG